ncbi:MULTISPECIES: hypothetical protein [Nostoc]|uniref:Uncharacterized protein n=1 Tax=Nostoc paludosum FACHB-159 TaxID=2692908 RepID=A0ABR8KLX2_9NOSO|nr:MULTISPECIES: hypothetical protein [Nostoc]MBD2682609.1 hypothetical protein [Nostoc sp. FACHB-857]MBD2738942.1 hypothetical protein [Nostoc paludosum FACHB-159]
MSSELQIPKFSFTQQRHLTAVTHGGNPQDGTASSSWGDSCVPVSGSSALSTQDS